MEQPTVTTEQENPQVEPLDEAPEAQAEANPEGAEAAEPAGLEARIAELEAELQQAKENTLRAAAEAQNIRRRAEADVEKAHKFGQEKIVSDMLVVADNLERALASVEGADEQFKSVTEGLELTLKSLIDGLKRHKVEQIDPKGEPFDPEFHQAMTMVPNPEVEPNTVMDVFQKGYTLHGRLVRPAMVVVAKAPE
ncbi:nucleotide exchange factor GrpE [Simiduia sp. 21SJ11W-1]|uniref:nucleotide exchange factor GrpE n=1 Tax=Simiduia sp. 21SJ11W-1 TaxID=2909669 RepID=UPI0020A19CE0|nr:nucleotide exchange factor GrpE [Simiduia sp. 21SJ11W-1]UTA47038.1 nucleotide exchange factor GrpE [Simiduia sp. 21SJ11W-1]